MSDYNTLVFTGKAGYVNKKLHEKMRAGWEVEKIHTHPDGTVTVKMIRI